MAVSCDKRQVIVQNEDDLSSEHEEDESGEELSVDEEEHESDSNKESDVDEDAENINAGWADSIARILKTNKPKGKKTLVLSKAKKLTDALREKPKPAGFQVEKVDGVIKEEEIQPTNDGKKTDDEPKRKRKKDILSIRLKPNILEKDRERILMKIATKGVVQLFNAVKTQQKDIKTKLQEAGPLEVRRDKVLKNIDKRAFLDVLMGEKSQPISDGVTKQSITIPKRETVEKPTWSVLRDDFMMGAKMKDWDKELEEEDEEMECEIEDNIESD